MHHATPPFWPCEQEQFLGGRSPLEARAEARAEGREVELEVSVLTAAHWPSPALVACKLPPELTPSFHEFQDFYLRKHTVCDVGSGAGARVVG